MSFGGGSDYVAGFKFYFGIHMGISRGPVDELVEIQVGDRTAWRGSVTANGVINIDAENLFGGQNGEGGIKGPLTVMMGGPTQTAPTELSTVLKTPMPGFRRMFTVFFDGLVSMMNPYPKPWKFRVRRARAGWDGAVWYTAKASIDLVRSLSAGEVAGSSNGATIETKTVKRQQFLYVKRNTGTGNLQVTLDNIGTLDSVDEVNVLAVGNIYDAFLAIAGLHYVVEPGRVLHFADVGEDLGGGVNTVNFDGAQISVITTRTVTTSDPTPTGLGDMLIRAMNPAHILWECYTNRDWGRGLPATSLDEPSWTYAADRLFNEGFGLCLRWTRQDSIQSFIQVVLDHIGAAVHPDRTTGKLKLKLIRDDYDPDTLPLFDADTGLISVKDAPVSAGTSGVNEIRVTYRDPVTNSDRTVRASNVANVQANRGAINSQTLDFPGAPTAEIASRIAKRELRAKSQSLRRFAITLDRRGFDVVPGSVIRIRDFVRNIPTTVVRVVNVDYGNLQNGRIEVVGMRDVFSTPLLGFPTIGPPQWTPPDNKPCLDEFETFELPYRTIFRTYSVADFNAIDPDAARIGAIVGSGQPLNLTFDVAIKEGAIDAGTETPPDDSYYCGYTP